MNRMPLYANYFLNEPAYIIGTGPSLDDFDMGSIPDNAVIIAIHRSIEKVKVNPGRTFWLVIDDIWENGTPGDWKKWLSETNNPWGITGLFRKLLLTGKGYRIAPKSKNIVPFMTPSGFQPQILNETRDDIASYEELYAFCGTLAPAIHFAWFCGCEQIHLVGIDGGGGHAQSLGDVYDDSENQTHYHKAKLDGLMAATELNVEIVDHGGNNV